MVKNKLANVTKKADLKENMWVKLKTCFRYILFGRYHFRLALWTHCQIHQKFWHGSDKSSFLQCQGFENVWSNHPSLLKWSNPDCILFVSGQVCSCLMIRRTSQRMSLVPSLFFCLLWLLCLLICISSIYHSAMYLVHFDLSTYTRLKYIHFGYLWKNFVQCTWLIYTIVHPYIYILNLVHLYLNVQVCYFAWSLRDSLWLAFSRRR